MWRARFCHPYWNCRIPNSLGSSVAVKGAVCAAEPDLWCAGEAGSENHSVPGLWGRMCCLLDFQNTFTGVGFSCNAVSSDLWMSGGKGGEIVSLSSLLLLHANKYSYRWKFIVNACSSKHFCMLAFLKWNNSPGKLCVTYTDPKK